MDLTGRTRLARAMACVAAIVGMHLLEMGSLWACPVYEVEVEVQVRGIFPEILLAWVLTLMLYGLFCIWDDGRDMPLSKRNRWRLAFAILAVVTYASTVIYLYHVEPDHWGVWDGTKTVTKVEGTGMVF